MIIAGVLLPCVPAVINVAFGYGIMSFSPMRCDVAVQDVSFYADALTEGVKVAIYIRNSAGTCLLEVGEGMYHQEFITVRVSNSLMVSIPAIWIG